MQDNTVHPWSTKLLPELGIKSQSLGEMPVYTLMFIFCQLLLMTMKHKGLYKPFVLKREPLTQSKTG